MRMITRMLLASVLAVGAGSFAGCGTTDCPSSVAQGVSCSTLGLTCGDCTCTGKDWACSAPDFPFPVPRDMAKPGMDLPFPTD